MRIRTPAEAGVQQYPRPLRKQGFNSTREPCESRVQQYPQPCEGRVQQYPQPCEGRVQQYPQPLRRQGFNSTRDPCEGKDSKVPATTANTGVQQYPRPLPRQRFKSTRDPCQGRVQQYPRPLRRQGSSVFPLDAISYLTCRRRALRCGTGGVGIVISSTPSLNIASQRSGSAPSGSAMEREKRP